MAEKIIILMPVFDDAESLNKLLPDLAASLKDMPGPEYSVLVVNDGSSERLGINTPAPFPLQVLHLQRNIGHQKAIAIGLAYIKNHVKCDKVLIMDSDGEDRPDDALALVRNSQSTPGKIVFAHRRKRQEGQQFIFFYALFKSAFRILTGKKISYGNFMVMPWSILEKVVYYSEIWNHVAGGIIKTGLPYVSIPTDRGVRYAGKSKMNFQSLFMHGLGAIAVFLEVIAGRLLVISLVLIGVSLLAILTMLGIKLFTDRAIPGWTSTLVSAMLIVLLQSFLLSLFTIFLYLSSQSQRKFIPANHYKDYSGEVETIS